MERRAHEGGASLTRNRQSPREIGPAVAPHSWEATLPAAPLAAFATLGGNPLPYFLPGGWRIPRY
jgi:hypothetical protein